MASKKAAEIVEEVPAVKADETVKAEKTAADPWTEMVKVRVPRRPKGEYFYVCVNDRRFEIPANGMEQEMPRPVAEILNQSIEAEYRAEDYAAGIPNRTGLPQ